MTWSLANNVSFDTRPPLTMVADKEKQVDIPGQAQVKNSTRNVKNQHESWRHLIQG